MLPARKWCLQRGPERSEVPSFVVTDCLFRLGPSHIPQPGMRHTAHAGLGPHSILAPHAEPGSCCHLVFHLTSYNPALHCPRKGPEPAGGTGSPCQGSGDQGLAFLLHNTKEAGILYSLLHTANTVSLPLCHGNVVDQFFCEIPHILKLSCSDAYLREVAFIVLSVLVFVGCFVFIVVSYVQIFRAVLRMPSEQGQHKAFSMCLPHLAVLSLLVSTATFANLKPPSFSSTSMNLVVSFLYSVMPPAMNPLIYSMRNQELKDTLKKLMSWTLFINNRLLISC